MRVSRQWSMCRRAKPAWTTNCRLTSLRRTASQRRGLFRCSGSKPINSGLQVARRERRALGGAETDAVPEVGFEIAVIGVDRFERGAEECRPYRAQHLPDVVGQVAAGIGIPA